MGSDKDKTELVDLDELQPNALTAMVSQTTVKLARQPSLVRVHGRVIVVGDTHGDIYSSSSAIERYLDDECTFLFLGDYVDRGPYQLENLIFLIRKLNELPGRLILLRGNHETPEMNKWYGFYDVVSRRYGPQIYDHFLSFFAQLPFSAIVNEQFIAIHGGIARSLRTMRQLAALPKGVASPTGMLAEILWNDPDDSIDGFAPNLRGPGTFRYGRQVVSDFLETNGLRALIRSHEPRSEGVSVEMQGKVYVVFSCRYYGIKPGALLVDGNEIVSLSL